MKLVIGIVGKICSGKGIIAEYLCDKHGASTYRFSDILRDLLQRLHLEDSRENLQNLGVALRNALGDGILADALKEDIKEDLAEMVVVDGIRYENEVELLRSLENNVLIFVTAPLETRYKRALKRGTRGEKGLIFENFKKSDERETEKLIDKIGERADVKIDNSGTLEELYEKIDDMIQNRLSGI